MNPFTWIKSKLFPAPSAVKSVLPADARIYVGDGTWPFVVHIVGNDAVLRPAAGRTMFATWFGGDNDPLDSGETASGVMTKGNPEIQGCALPMRYTPACAGSPLPKLPWRTMVEVAIGTSTIVVPLIDVGPNRRTGNTIDLTLAAFKRFAPLKVGKLKVLEIVILGGAKYFV